MTGVLVITFDELLARLEGHPCGPRCAIRMGTSPVSGPIDHLIKAKLPANVA